MKTVKTTVSVLLAVLLLLTLAPTAFAAGKAKIDSLDTSAIDNAMWMSAGGEDNLWWIETGIPLLKSRLAAL